MQITLRLYKKTVKTEKALWYQLELKNVGKKKILVTDKIFRDPWAMRENCTHQYGIYLEVIDPDGQPAQPRADGEGQVKWDYIENTEHLGPKDMADLNTAKAEWNKKGLVGRERAAALEQWNNDWNERMKSDENIKKQFWLPPGASTRTFAWAYAITDADVLQYVPKEKRVASYDEEEQVGDYTQLWTYHFMVPGKYRIRAVYDHGTDEDGEKLNRKYGISTPPWRVEVKTPFIEFKVRK